MPTRSKHRKADGATIDGRIDEIIAIRNDGASFIQVQQYSAAHAWGGEPGAGLSERQLWVYWTRASKRIKEHQEKNRALFLAEHLSQRTNLYARAVNAADLRTALAILDSKARLQGLLIDSKELRELAKLLAEQTKQIAALEEAANAVRANQSPRAEQPEAACEVDREPSG